MAKHVQGSAVANATSYKLYNTGTGAELMTQSSGGNIDFDLSTLGLAAGTYSLAVKAFDNTGTYATSDFSNTVSYTVESDATTYIFSVDASPSSALITLTASGYTTITGTGAAQITVANGTKVDWSVSASGYITQNGTWTANGKAERKSVTLVKDEAPKYYPVDPATVTASGAQLGGNYAFAQPLTADTEARRYTHLSATFYPKTAKDFNIVVLVGEFDVSDNSMMIVKKYTHTIPNTATGALPVELDIDVPVAAGQLIGINAATHYVYMTAGSPYAGVFNMLFGNSDSFTEGSKLSANPSTAAGKIPLVFFS